MPENDGQPPIVCERQWILYVPTTANAETQTILDAINRHNLSDIVQVKELSDDDAKTREILQAISGGEVRLPYLEVTFLCETDAVLGYMGREEIMGTFRDYSLMPND